MQYIIYRNNVEVAKVRPLGSQNKQVMGANTVTMSFALRSFIEFKVGDYVDVYGDRYYLNYAPAVQEVSSRNWKYQLELQAIPYDLIRSKFFTYDSGNQLRLDEFTLTANASTFIDLIITNVSRTQSGWTKGQVDATRMITLSFSNENCMAVLARLAQEFNTEYWIDGKTIHLNKQGEVLPLTLAYGRGNGLRSVERTPIDDNPPITRLYVYGAEKNTPANYRGYSKRLMLPDTSAPNGYIEANTSLYGIREEIYKNDDIYPHRLGTVTATSAINSITDTGLNFDINAQLVPGTSAKIVFNSGLLSGYTFDIRSYNHTTKTITFNQNTDEKAFVVPSATMKPQIGDQWVLIDVIMPQSYITAAEAELLQVGTEYLAQNSGPRYNYSLTTDPLHFQRANIQLGLGKYLTLQVPEWSLNLAIRIIGYTRDLNKPFQYSQVEVSNATQIHPAVIAENKQREIIRDITITQKEGSLAKMIADAVKTKVGIDWLPPGTTIIDPATGTISASLVLTDMLIARQLKTGTSGARIEAIGNTLRFYNTAGNVQRQITIDANGNTTDIWYNTNGTIARRQAVEGGKVKDVWNDVNGNFVIELGQNGIVTVDNTPETWNPVTFLAVATFTGSRTWEWTCININNTQPFTCESSTKTGRFVMTNNRSTPIGDAFYFTSQTDFSRIVNGYRTGDYNCNTGYTGGGGTIEPDEPVDPPVDPPFEPEEPPVQTIRIADDFTVSPFRTSFKGAINNSGTDTKEWSIMSSDTNADYSTSSVGMAAKATSTNTYSYPLMNADTTSYKLIYTLGRRSSGNSTSRNIAACFRYKDLQNNFILKINNDGVDSAWLLRKRIANAEYDLGIKSTTNAVEGDVLEIINDGPVITVVLNGVTLGTVTDSELTESTLVGVRGRGNLDQYSSWKSFEINIQEQSSLLKYYYPYPIGYAMNHDITRTNYLEALKTGSMINPETAFGIKHTQPGPTTWAWQDADICVNFAQANGIKYIHGSHLLWANDNNLGNYFILDFENQPNGKQLIKDFIINHVTQKVTRYRGKVKTWNALNEFINDDGTIEDCIYTRLIPDFDELVEIILTTAITAAPENTYIYNDFNLETGNLNRTNRLIAAMDALLAKNKYVGNRRVKIDGVGFQFHTFRMPDDPDFNRIESRFDRWFERGLKVAITELDISPTPSTPTEAWNIELADRYERIVSTLERSARKYPAGVSNILFVCFWAVTDRESHLNIGKSAPDSANPINNHSALHDYYAVRKLAYHRLLEFGHNRALIQ